MGGEVYNVRSRHCRNIATGVLMDRLVLRTKVRQKGELRDEPACASDALAWVETTF